MPTNFSGNNLLTLPVTVTCDLCNKAIPEVSIYTSIVPCLTNYNGDCKEVHLDDIDACYCWQEKGK